MATGKVYYWLKLKKNFMTSDTVDFLMSQPDGANYVVLYQMLHLMTINTEGQLSRTIGDVIIPYDVKKIQRDTKWFTIDTINVALSIFMKLGLVYKDENGVLVMTDHKELVGKETDYAPQKRNQRAVNAKNKKALPGCGQCPPDVHENVHTEIRDKRLEIRDKRVEIRDKNTNMSVSDETDCCTDVQRIVDAWNAIDGIPKVQKVTPDSKRGKSLRARIKEYGVDTVLEAIGKIQESPFLMGKTRKPFNITFDWFIRPNNFPKVLEGNYSDRPKRTFEKTDIAYRAARKLGRLVSERAGVPEPKEETLQAWAGELADCVAENQTSFDDFADVMAFSQEDPFWRKTVLDAASLRKHYVKLMAEMNDGGRE